MVALGFESVCNVMACAAALRAPICWTAQSRGGKSLKLVALPSGAAVSCKINGLVLMLGRLVSTASQCIFSAFPNRPYSHRQKEKGKPRSPSAVPGLRGFPCSAARKAARITRAEATMRMSNPVLPEFQSSAVGLGKFADAARSWDRMISNAEASKCVKVFCNCCTEGANFVSRGANPCRRCRRANRLGSTP